MLFCTPTSAGQAAASLHCFVFPCHFVTPLILSASSAILMSSAAHHANFFLANCFLAPILSLYTFCFSLTCSFCCSMPWHFVHIYSSTQAGTSYPLTALAEQQQWQKSLL
ncbi:hypothetical protein ABPG75_013145 [Micractinium tetrahymenae]